MTTVNTQLSESYGIRFRKGKVLLLLIFGIFMTVVSGAFIMYPETFALRVPKEYVLAVGIAGFLFFGFGTIGWFRRLFGMQLCIVINSKYLDISPAKPFRIKWIQIVGLSEVTIKGSKSIVIHIYQPESWIALEKRASRRALMRANLALYGSPFVISTVAADISHAELLSLLHHCIERFGNQNIADNLA